MLNMYELQLKSIMSEFTDEQLVEKTRSTDKEYYAEIIKRYQHKLLRYAQYLVQNEDKAADVVQESFIKAYMNLNAFNTKKKFSSWIYRIVHNEAMNNLNKTRKEISLNTQWELISEHDVEKELDTKEIVVQVKQCLDNVPLLYSEPLALFYLDGKSYEDISDILRLPMGTVATRINRAKSLMKHICKKK